MEAVRQRKVEGRFGDRIRLNVLVMAAQYKEMQRIASITGQTITDLTIEALQYWLNATRKDGV